MRKCRAEVRESCSREPGASEYRQVCHPGQPCHQVLLLHCTARQLNHCAGGGGERAVRPGASPGGPAALCRTVGTVTGVCGVPALQPRLGPHHPPRPPHPLSLALYLQSRTVLQVKIFTALIISNSQFNSVNMVCKKNNANLLLEMRPDIFVYSRHDNSMIMHCGLT